MAKEDFCFTYYDGDAARDMTHMNRLERGAYQDLIICQRKFGHLTLEQVKKILGRDFEECWPALELILNRDADGKFFIEWLHNSIETMRTNSRLQSKRGKEGGRGNKKSRTKAEQKPEETQTKTKKSLKGDGNGDGDGDGSEVETVGGEGEGELKQLEDAINLAFDDIYLEQQRMKWPHLDFDFEFRTFIEKVRGSPGEYANRDSPGLRLAFQYQLRNAKPRKNATGKETPTDLAVKFAQRVQNTPIGPPG